MIKLVAPNHIPVETLTVEMRYDDDGEGGTIPSIYYDHICVAYISDVDGAINALTLETGPYSCGGQIKEVEYLKARGVLLEITRVNGEYTDYQVCLERGYVRS